MKPEHRSALLALAARRGQKGFSAVLADAVEEYLKGAGERERRREALLSLAGTLSGEDVEELRSHAQAVRESWR